MSRDLDLTSLLQALVDRAGSDLHVRAGTPPAVRVGGRLQRLDEVAATAEGVARLAQQVLGPEEQKRLLRGETVVVAHSVAGVGRFRIAAFRQRGTASLVAHTVTERVRPLAQLGLPRAATAFAAARRGMVLVGAPAGHGGTTTLAALVDEVNRTRDDHVVTVEDPIEVLHADSRSLITQLEVGSDVPDLAAGVRSATRLDADVVVVSQVESRDVALAALDAVAHGSLVMAGVRGATVVDVLDGFLDLFTFEERPVIRHSLARALTGVVAQRLVPGIVASPVLVAEALLNTPKIEAVIRDAERRNEIVAVIEAGTFDGMVSLDQCLVDRVRSGAIAESVALSVASRPEELRIELARA